MLDSFELEACGQAEKPTYHYQGAWR